MEELQNIKDILELLDRINWEEEEVCKTILSLTDDVNKLIQESENKPKYQLNLLDLVNISEPLTSQFLKLLFEYSINNEKVICKSFLNRFLAKSGFRSDWFSNPTISAEMNRIDVGINESGKYTVIVENKLKGAVFQRNQLARYIQIMRNQGYKDEQIFVVVLPGFVADDFLECINNSVWRLPEDWRKPNYKRKCAYNKIDCSCDSDGFDETSEMCVKCVKDLREKFKSRTKVLDVDMLEWLENDCLTLIPNDELVFRSAVIQFIDFLKGRYNKRLNNKLMMEIEKFLRGQLFSSGQSALDQWNLIDVKKKEVNNLLAGLENLQESVVKDIIDEWRIQLSSKWGARLKFKSQESFWIDIEGVQCGCWIDGNPYWGFYSDAPKKKQEKIVYHILEEVGIIDWKCDDGWIAWAHTFDGADICDRLYNAAKALGYLE